MLKMSLGKVLGCKKRQIDVGAAISLNQRLVFYGVGIVLGYNMELVSEFLNLSGRELL